MGRQPQTIEEWVKGEKPRQDWLDQKLRDAGLRRLTQAGQDTVDSIISDLEEALPKGAGRAEAIRKLKQNWRVFKSSQKNKTTLLSANVSKRTLKSLKELARARQETQKDTLEKLIKEGFQTETDKKEACKQALNQQRSDLSLFIPLATVKEVQELRAIIDAKDQEIADLKRQLSKLQGTPPTGAPDSKPDCEESQATNSPLFPFIDQKSSF